MLFLLLALATVPLAVGIGAGSRRAWDLAAAMSATAIVAYALARTTGLPLYHERDWMDAMGWVPVGLLSVVVESLFLLIYVRGKQGSALGRRRFLA